MKAKENQRVVVTKKMLQNGLIRLLEKKNIQEISVTELCREAEINRTTFYKHYSTPYDVLTDWGNSLAQEFLDAHDVGNVAAPLDHRAFCVDLCRYLYRHSDVMKVLIKYNLDSNISRVLHNFPQTHAAMTEHLQKRFKEDQVDLVAAFIYSGGYSLIRKWIMEDVSKTPEEIASLIISLATSGWGEE